MNKSAIFLTLLLLGSIAGTYAVYELYVSDRMRELGEHKEQHKRLVERIKTLEETFLKTDPQVVLDAWRGATQPWSEAVDTRSDFFTLGSLVEKVEIPQEILPKIYYRDEIPKRLKKLEDYAADKQVTVADTKCGAPAENAYGQGTNPKSAEIAKVLEDFDYCAAITRMLIDARPVQIQPLQIWPESSIQLKSGKIVIRTTGVTLQTSMQSLARFFDSLAQSDRYFRIEGMKLSNTNLNQTDPLLIADFVLSQAYFVPSVKGAAPARNANQKLNTVFATNPNVGVPGEPELSWWQRFRRSFLPF